MCLFTCVKFQTKNIFAAITAYNVAQLADAAKIHHQCKQKSGTIAFLTSNIRFQFPNCQIFKSLIALQAAYTGITIRFRRKHSKKTLKQSKIKTADAQNIPVSKI